MEMSRKAFFLCLTAASMLGARAFQSPTHSLSGISTEMSASVYKSSPPGRKTGFPPTSLANWQVDDLPTFRSNDKQSAFIDIDVGRLQG
jgi:hypothetical protein